MGITSVHNSELVAPNSQSSSNVKNIFQAVAQKIKSIFDSFMNHLRELWAKITDTAPPSLSFEVAKTEALASPELDLEKAESPVISATTPNKSFSKMTFLKLAVLGVIGYLLANKFITDQKRTIFLNSINAHDPNDLGGATWIFRNNAVHYCTTENYTCNNPRKMLAEVSKPEECKRKMQECLKPLWDDLRGLIDPENYKDAESQEAFAKAETAYQTLQNYHEKQGEIWV